MRKYIVLALVLLAGGVGVSFYLIPTGEEITAPKAPMPMPAMPAAAPAAPGAPTAAPTPTATATPAPDLSTMDAAALDALAQSAPTEANLRALSDVYNAKKEYQKQAGVLKKLLEVTKGNNPQAFVDLATIQVVLGDTEGALATVDQLKAQHPSFSSYALTRVVVGVLAGKGEGDKALAAAKGWMEQANAPVPSAAMPAPAAAPAPVATVLTAGHRPNELADFINLLHYAGHADKALALAEPYPALFVNAPDLVLAYVNASITAGKSDAAYAMLKQLDEAGQMTAPLTPPYLDLTLKREDMAAANSIATRITPATFSEAQALNTLDIARAHAASAVLATLSKRFSDATVLKDKPVLAAVIAILTGDKTQDATIQAALAAPLTSTQRVSLAEACARAKKTTCFESLVKQYPAIEQQSPVQIAEYAQLHIIANRAGDVVERVGKRALAQGAAEQVQVAYRRLASAAGRHDLMNPWLQAHATTAPIAQLQELFYLAHDRGHAVVASDIAERLYARDPSPMNRNALVSAYLGAGHYAKALPHLRTQLKEPGANDAVYISTLSKQARTDKAARKELADYAEAALKIGYGDAKAQLNYAYVLINQGRKDIVLPIAKANAASKGGEWKKLYAQLTQKAGAGTASLSREQMVAMAASPTISREQRRQLGFNLIAAGHKADGVTIFKALAQDKGPESQEVKDLMYLWGEPLSGEALAWVKGRATRASAYDASRWNEMLASALDGRPLLAYVGENPRALYTKTLRQKYFRVLAASGNRDYYESAMKRWVAETTDVPALLDYASIGQSAGYKQAALAGYHRVLMLDANNGRALAQIAALDYTDGAYKNADARLNQFIYTQQQRPDPEANSSEAHFYKAQLLRRQGKKAEANAEFAYVVQQGATTPDAWSRVYTSQFHLGRHSEAKAGFERLLAQQPDDQSLLADYMSVLIEYHYLEDATRIANRYDKTSPYYRKGAALAGNRGETLATRPGYVIRFVPTANERLEAAPTTRFNHTPQAEMTRQQQLRLQLLYARIEQQSGQADKAAQRLAALERYFPNDPQLLAYKASVASAQGDNDEALDLLERAQTLAPQNEDLSLQVQNIRRIDTGKSYAKLDHEYRQLGDHQEQITTLSGVATAGRTEFGVIGQNDALAAENIRRARDGTVGDYDATRQRGELFLARTFDGGTRAQASLYGNNKDAGGGLNVAFNSPLGRTELLGEFQRPYWDFVEAVYEHATRDRIGIKDFAALQPGTTLGVEASVNRYNTDEESDVARSILARLNLVQQLQPETATQPYLGLGYGFDGEYLTGKPDWQLDGSGEGYYLLPVRTREVHALTGILRSDVTPQTHTLLIGGVAYDRINGGVSPLAEGHVDHDLDDHWQVGARARYAQETNNTDNQELRLGADVLYKF